MNSGATETSNSAFGFFVKHWTPESRRLANRRLLEGLLAIWDEVPDQRFGQLVANLSRTDGGFADTWEWSHQRWYSALNEAAKTWVAHPNA